MALCVVHNAKDKILLEGEDLPSDEDGEDEEEVFALRGMPEDSDDDEEEGSGSEPEGESSGEEQSGSGDDEDEGQDAHHVQRTTT